jgi:hypothetical protein
MTIQIDDVFQTINIMLTYLSPLIGVVFGLGLAMFVVRSILDAFSAGMSNEPTHTEPERDDAQHAEPEPEPAEEILEPAPRTYHWAFPDDCQYCGVALHQRSHCPGCGAPVQKVLVASA